MRDLTRDLGVGTCCGKCVPEARAILSASLDSCNSAASAYFPSSSPEFAV
jgi:bacterioferritin-associated ferredoxin